MVTVSETFDKTPEDLQRETILRNINETKYDIFSL